ncbi:MAG: thiol reductant ABC exporter subunit CydC [Mycobacterium sp.]
MPSRDPLIPALRLLRPNVSRLLIAVALGVASLCSALALAGVAAWLITKAWEMPPVLDLSVAAVTVRALGISRGVFHYLERLASHDCALRAAGAAREGIYLRLATGSAATTARLHSGELVARMGGDVDQLADVLVRAVLPIGVAAVLTVAATSVITLISPAAAAVLLISLLVAGVLGPWLAGRAVAAQETIARASHGERDVAALLALEHADELRVGGRLDGVVAEAHRRQREWGSALDRAARPAALAAAVPVLATAASVIGAVVAGIALAPTVAPTTLAILMLLPLSAFEATTALPGAVIQLTRSRIAARRLLDLADGPAAEGSAERAAPLPPHPTLSAEELVAGFAAHSELPAVTLTLEPGARLAVTGPSGTGKTTLLMTLAGLIPARAGNVRLAGQPIAAVDEHDIRSAVTFFAEDAHIFATTVRDNLLVARGDCTDEELCAALRTCGLGPWLAALPDGLATLLDGGAAALSAGQRRRLLLARVVVSQAPVVLLDEPTEHIERGDAEPILRALLGPRGDLLSAHRTVVVATHHLPAGLDCAVLPVRP